MDLLDITLSDALAYNAKHYRDNTAYIFEDTVYTWGATEAITDRMASMMLQSGIRKGSRLGLWSVNTVALAFTLYAAMKVGAVPVIFNYSYKELELGSVLAYSDTQFMFYGSSTGSLSYPDILARVKEKSPSLQACLDMEALLREEETRFLEGTAMEDKAREELNRAKAAVKSGDTACMLFTSGTTKRPKGVLLSHHGVLNNAREISALMHWDREQDRLLSAMPIFHCSGMTCGLMLGVVMGMTVVLMRTFKAEQAMELIQRYRCTAFNVVPSMILQIIQHPRFGQYDLSSWRSGTASGSGITAERYEAIMEKLNVPYLQMAYGQTETSPLITFSKYEDDAHTKATTIGVPIPNMEVRVWNENEGREAEVNEVGELQARGFCVMQGYYKLEEENRKKFWGDGWMRTGDLGFRDEAGYFHFTSRMSDMIIRGGENIAPAEIECVIRNASSDIRETKVIGLEVNTAIQEEIVAFVQAAPGVQLDGKRISGYVKQHLASFKAPKYVWQLEEFPVTGSGKIDQKALKLIAMEKFALEVEGGMASPDSPAHIPYAVGKPESDTKRGKYL